MLEMCLVKEHCPSSLESLPYVPVMLPFKWQWGCCCKGCVQTWHLEHYPVDLPSKVSGHLC